jgi:methyltransferase
MSVALYVGVIALTALERLVELVVATRNAAWSFERGGVEYGKGHFPFMVVLHTGFLIACVAEVVLLERAFVPALGWPMLALAIACQGLRWWCITTLGERWNTRVIIVPGLAPVTGGPYRFFKHPNYVAVALEGLALPLMHGAWLTAAAFTVLNAGLMVVRIRTEDAALATLPEPT